MSTSTTAPLGGQSSPNLGPITGNSFLKRQMSVTFALGTGTFGQTGSNVVTLPSAGNALRMSAQITKAGGASMGELRLRIWGMDSNTQNTLSTLGLIAAQLRRNSVSVSVGDAVNGMATVFQGNIIDAWVDLRGLPDAPFHVSAYVGPLLAVIPVAPTSFTGAASVATIMSGLAAQAGLTFENNGVQTTLDNPYFPGTVWEQIDRCATAANIGHVVDLGKLAIWPQGGTRGGQVPVLSEQTGMTDPPSYTSNGIEVHSLFNPNIGYGTTIQVKSVLPNANGQWFVYSLDYNLEVEEPEGNWNMRMLCSPPGFTPVS